MTNPEIHWRLRASGALSTIVLLINSELAWDTIFVGDFETGDTSRWQ